MDHYLSKNSIVFDYHYVIVVRKETLGLFNIQVSIYPKSKPEESKIHSQHQSVKLINLKETLKNIEVEIVHYIITKFYKNYIDELINDGYKINSNMSKQDFINYFFQFHNG